MRCFSCEDELVQLDEQTGRRHTDSCDYYTADNSVCSSGQVCQATAELCEMPTQSKNELLLKSEQSVSLYSWSIYRCHTHFAINKTYLVSILTCSVSCNEYVICDRIRKQIGEKGQKWFGYMYYDTRLFTLLQLVRSIENFRVVTIRYLYIFCAPCVGMNKAIQYRTKRVSTLMRFTLTALFNPTSFPVVIKSDDWESRVSVHYCRYRYNSHTLLSPQVCQTTLNYATSDNVTVSKRCEARSSCQSKEVNYHHCYYYW